MKRWIKPVGWVLVTAGLIVLLSFVVREQSRVICREVAVNVDGNRPWCFVTVEDVKQHLSPMIDTLMDKPLSDWDVQVLEKRVKEMPAVFRAEVYSSIGGQLRVDVEQRRPIARLISNFGSQAYVDSTGTLMPVNRKWVAHLPVINGHLGGKLSYGKDISETDSTREGNLLNGVYKMAEFIHSSQFWKAQVQQIYVNENKSFECIPRVGNHTIVLGGAAELESKFKKLDLLYERGFSSEDWNRYSKIDLTYKDQIVCTLK